MTSPRADSGRLCARWERRRDRALLASGSHRAQGVRALGLRNVVAVEAQEEAAPHFHRTRIRAELHEDARACERSCARGHSPAHAQPLGRRQRAKHLRVASLDVIRGVLHALPRNAATLSATPSSRAHRSTYSQSSAVTCATSVSTSRCCISETPPPQTSFESKRSSGETTASCASPRATRRRRSSSPTRYAEDFRTMKSALRIHSLWMTLN